LKDLGPGTEFFEFFISKFLSI